MEKVEQKWLKEIHDNTKQLERIAKRLDAIYRQLDRLDHKGKPQTCDTCRNHTEMCLVSECHYEPETENEILREQCRAFIDIVKQTERGE